MPKVTCTGIINFFISQVNIAIKIAEFKCPPTNNTIVFLFDQSLGHCVFAHDALRAHKMNVSKWWKAPISTKYSVKCKTTKMFTPTGQQKGLKTVLEKGGVNAKNE